MEAPRDAQPRLIYAIEDRPPVREVLPLGFQHLMAMLLGNITPPLVVAGALALVAAETVTLLQAVLLMAGVATLVQAYPVGPVGGRIPMVMGTSFAFVGAAIAIGRSHGLAGIFGACLVAALVEVVMGFGIVRLRRLFPPLVSSIVVMLIGLTLMPVGMDYAAGGVAAADYGHPEHLAIAAVVLAVTLVLNRWARGFLAYASLLAGVAAGYAVALGLGRVDFTAVSEAGWWSLPRFLPYGLELPWGGILAMAFAYVVSTMETIGDISGVLAATGRDPTNKELRGGLVADGVMSGLAALFGTLPNTSYSQNVGLVSFTGVASRHVTAVAGGFLILLGLSPKIGALFATLPPAVIGGGAFVMFGMIFSSGAAIFHRSVAPTRRNLVILAVSVALGLSVQLRPDALAQLPQVVQDFFGAGLVTGGLAALVLNAVFPERRDAAPGAGS